MALLIKAGKPSKTVNPGLGVNYTTEYWIEKY